MIKRFINWLRSKFQIVKPGIDIEIIGTVAIIRIDAGRLKIIWNMRRYFGECTNAEAIKKLIDVIKKTKEV